MGWGRLAPFVLLLFAARGLRTITARGLGPGAGGPGDIVAWRLPGGLHHIGVVSSRRAPGQARYLVVHNIGRGTQLEDVLYAFEKLGHYRW